MGLGALETIASKDALVVFDAEMRVVQWNRAAEDLLGADADQVVGRYCWQVLPTRDGRGAELCRAGCTQARLARKGWPLRCLPTSIPTPSGRRRIAASTVVVPGGEGTLLCCVLREERGTPSPATRRSVQLTARQRQVLELLATGMRVQRVALRLGIAETTARNHVRAILAELHAHSQLEAVARARDLGLV